MCILLLVLESGSDRGGGAVALLLFKSCATLRYLLRSSGVFLQMFQAELLPTPPFFSVP